MIAAHVEPALVIERRVDGFETSVHVVWDGESYILLPPVRDYKRVGDGDTGQNPYGAASLACGARFRPRARTAAQRADYRADADEACSRRLCLSGFRLFRRHAARGRPHPPDLVVHAAEGSLHKVRVEWREDSYCGAVFAMAAGYPEVMDPDTAPIAGLEEALLTGQVVLEDVAETDDGTLVVAGGRVATPVVLAPSIDKTRQAAQEALSHIRFEEMHFRSDLGFGIDARLFAAGSDE